MSTRIIHGTGVLSGLGDTTTELGLRNVLVITDQNITPQAFYSAATSSLSAAGVAVNVYDGCGIDAHLAEVDELAARVRRDGIDGIIAIGGGSAMCVGKAVAIVATNPPSFRDCAGVASFTNRALKMIMIPTTAGSGAEVSQFTLVKDDENETKFVGGGPLSFPDVAVLDPEVLSGIPPRLAAVSAVDALSHAVEAMFTEFATPLTDGLATTAVSLLFRSAPAAILERNEAACTENLLGSAIANMACGNARLGLAHALSLPLEAQHHLPHGYGVGVLLPHVLAFNAPIAAPKVRQLALAFGVREQERPDEDVLAGVIAAIRSFYDRIDFPQSFAGLLDEPSCLNAVARAAVPGLYGTGSTGNISDASEIASPNIRQARVSDAEDIYRACFSTH
ncbi:iron-containing alcohol dehydrogenase [Roseovarius sp. CAU 1744]|uniref:iron-containing alcohol dehydrogenase n=1 Tax=Roseovarius sp. CAU 1744 TaxID=3140368 RepID=UPI00325B69CD